MSSSSSLPSFLCCRRRPAASGASSTSFLPGASAAPSAAASVASTAASTSVAASGASASASAAAATTAASTSNANVAGPSTSSTTKPPPEAAAPASTKTGESSSSNNNNTAAATAATTTDKQKNKSKAENRVCPITGAIGYCPMARPKGGRQPGEKLPELQVMMLLVWEDGDSKVSIGVYPHMSKHWEALELPDSSSKEEIRARFRQLSVKFHPDKNSEPGAKERFQSINDAYTALRDVDGTLAFPWDAHPDKQQTMTGLEALRAFGNLGKEAATQDPIKAQMMQHVVKESTECKVLIWKNESSRDGMLTSTTQADALCVDTRNGSNHLVKVFRRIVSVDPAAAAAAGDALDEPC